MPATIDRVAPSATVVDAGGRIEIRGVHKHYGPTHVLNDINLDVQPGKVTVILGPSGSGKTTLLRSINHLEKVDAGYIAIDNEMIGYQARNGKLHELKEQQILLRRTKVGMVFQSFNLFPHLTVLENVIEAPLWVKKEAKDEVLHRAHQLLDRVGLAHKAQAYPRQLSGGQQQRVAIARALALRPKVLLFDEPTSALDPELVGEVLDVIQDLTKTGTTLVIVTHEIGFAREVAHHTVFLDQGRVVEQGPPNQVLGCPQHPRTREFLARVL
jgi:polar amino acid transport system ATP-binding protein